VSVQPFTDETTSNIATKTYARMNPKTVFVNTPANVAPR
jgi:lactate dehydrogenase-like 2-hydroxyacid dehydrogenase